jgi:elongation factor P hydroxylase
MAELQQQVWLTYKTFACCACGVEVALPSNFEEHRRRDHAFWYCPNGHAQHFAGKSDVEIVRAEAQALREKLAAETKRREWAQKDAANHADEIEKLKRKAKRAAKRAANGVCPCCTRSFVNLRRHMETKHPEHSPSTSKRT